MVLGSGTKHRKLTIKEKAQFAFNQKRLNISLGRLKQPGGRFQRREKPREGIRLDS